MAMSKTTLVANKRLAGLCYIDSGAPDNLIPSKGELCAYTEFASLT